LPSRDTWLTALVGKEWRELMASRAWWIFLFLIGPLVGVSFISAVRTYAEASGLNGTAAGVGEAFSPLVGVWAPTFSACELAAAFLWPFVVIRLVGGDRQSGALKLELQHRVSAFARLWVKVLVLGAGWIAASTAPLVAVVLWKIYGGVIYLPELGSVIFGHVLNAGLTIAVGAAAACVTEHPSTAAIVTLGVTVGTWVLNFIAAVHGGLWERLAGYTPTAMVAELQHGLVRLDVILVATTFIVSLVAFGAIWIRLGVAASRRIRESLVLGAATAVIVWGCHTATASWDISENRGNSFPKADEEALREIHAPLRMVVHLAPEDPRRSDLERRSIAKLRRVLPSLDVQYESTTSIGLFEQTNPHYGEIWYELGGRTSTSRSVTPEGVLERIYELAGVSPGAEHEEDIFRGHPLAVPPRGAAIVFYAVWPVVVTGAAFIWRRTS
jgi:hypothetical protein